MASISSLFIRTSTTAFELVNDLVFLGEKFVRESLAGFLHDAGVISVMCG